MTDSELKKEHMEEFNKIRSSLINYLNPDKLNEHQKIIRDTEISMSGPLLNISKKWNLS